MPSSRPLFLVVLLLPLVLPLAAAADSLTLAWDPPTDSVTAGYIVWVGHASRTYTRSIDVGLTVTHRVTDLAADTPYCLAVQAYDSAGRTSELSAEVCTRTAASVPPPSPPAPSAPALDPPPSSTSPAAAGDEIVLYAWHAQPHGHWSVGDRADAAEGHVMRSPDHGWASTSAPLAAPAHYFDLRFMTRAHTP